MEFIVLGRDFQLSFDVPAAPVRHIEALWGCANGEVRQILDWHNDAYKVAEDGRRYFRTVLTFAENQAAGLTRSPTLFVRVVGAKGTLGPWQEVEARNPPPLAPQLSMMPGLASATVNIVRTDSSLDHLGYRILVSDQPDFNPATGEPLYELWVGDSFTYPVLEDNPDLEAYVAAVDVFGPTNLDYAQIALEREVPSVLVQPIQDALTAQSVVLAQQVQQILAEDLVGIAEDLAAHEQNITSSLYQNGEPVNRFAEAVFDRVDAVEASQTQVVSQVSAQAGAIAAATQQVETLASDTEALSTEVNTLVTGFGNRVSQIEGGQTTLANAITAEATTRNSQISAVEDDFASSIKTVTTSVDNERSRIDGIDTQLVTFAGNIGNLQTQSAANADAISAETTARTTAVSQVGNNLSSHVTAYNTRVGNVESRAGALETLTSSHGSSIANHTTQIGTLTTDLGAEVTARTALATQLGNNLTALTNEVTLRNTQYTAQGTINSGLTSRMGSAESTISSHQTTLTNGSLATASSVSNVTARLNSGGDVYASITNAHQAGVTAQGMATATSRLEIGANGMLTGYRATAGAGVSQFVISASTFKVVDPNASNVPVQVFVVNQGRAAFAGNVDINGNLIVNGTINNGAIQPNTITSMSVAYNGALTNLSGATAFAAQGVWITVEKPTSPVDIFFNCLVNYVHNAGGSFSAYVTLWRSNGTTSTPLQSFTLFGSGMANDTFQGFIPVAYVDRPGAAGAFHYYVTLATNTSSMSTQTVAGRYMRAMEFKTNTDGTVGTGTGSSGGGGTPPPDTGGGGGTDPYDPGGGGSCPVAETAITMGDHSTKLAGDIVPGDLVWTRHETTRVWGAYEVSHVSRSVQQTWTVELENGTTLKASTNHRFLLPNNKWVYIQDVKAGMALQGNAAKFIVAADSQEADQTEVMKITVADAHTYMTAGVVSHNVKPIYVDP